MNNITTKQYIKQANRNNQTPIVRTQMDLDSGYEADVLLSLAKGHDLEDLLTHSAKDFKQNLTEQNRNHVNDLISILSK